MRKILKPICMLFLCMAVFYGCQGRAEDMNVLYQDSIRDAAFAESDEILPLVSLTPNDKMTTWDQKGRVLLCTWHDDAALYSEGKEVTVEWGPVWMFTDKEITKYKEELKESDNPQMRLRQLIGLPPDCDYTNVTGFWVDPDDVKRPAYQTDVTLGKMTTSFDENIDKEFKEWFDRNIIGSYFEGAYPWTRLGYTYDWADNDTEYGLTEFLVLNKSKIKVEFTDTTEEFIKRITK